MVSPAQSSPEVTSTQRGSHQRVIPRPSELRSNGQHRQLGASEVALADDLTIDLGLSPTVGADPALVEPEQTSWPIASLRVVGVLGGIAAGVAFGALGLFGKAETSAGAIAAPLLVVIGAVFIQKFARPRLGEFAAAVVLAGFGARLAGAVPRLVTGADAEVYQREGVRIAQSLRVLDLGVETGRSVPGTGTVRYVSGIVNVFTFGNYVTTFLVFVSIAFIGQVFLLFAAQPALSTKQMRVFTVLVMFSPTMVYWPSSIGKESLVLFGVGLSFFGVSRLYDRSWLGLAPLLIGGLAVGLVRPHVSMLLLAGLFTGLFSRSSGTKRKFAIHLVVLTLFIVGAMLATGASARLFNFESFDGVGDVSAVLDFTEDRTTQDASEFKAARVNSITDYPMAVVTVLFRPFLWEASGVPAMMSALEGVGLGLLSLYAVGGILSQFKVIASRGQLLFAASYTSIFIFVFAAIGNFGILSRQRAQVIPFVLLLIAVGVGAGRIGSNRTEPV